MDDFINTIDVLGDDAVIDSIIDKTITEFKDDKLTNVNTYAFRNCDKLVTLDLPNVNFAGRLDLTNCSSLVNLSLPKVTSAPAMNGCSSIKSISFPLENSTTTSHFANCTSLESVDLPNITFIGQGAFTNCTSLKRVCFPSVTSGLFMAFTNSGVEYADFPVLETMDNAAFQNAKQLKSLLLRNNIVVPIKSTNVLNATKIATGTGYIYVPKALVDSYKAATNWSTYATQFRALEDYTVDGTITGELDETKI